MMDFIFFISIFLFILLIISILLELYAVGVITSFGLMVAGLYILINGMADINNLLTTAFGMICVCVGLYVSLVGTTEEIEKVM